MAAKGAHLWTILTDSKPKGLRGFGDLPPDVAQSVDKHVSRLLELLHALK